MSSIISLSISALWSQNNNAFPVQVRVANGIIEGDYDTDDDIQTYLGVPFAQPPVGELRWRAPQPLEDWEGVLETKTFGPRPMQRNVFGDMKSRSAGVSEDCLYLNVWTPARRNTTGLPVLVYFYGGGFVAGDASEYRYDGESMAKKGIVVVTVNYRLNIFGFFAHPELSAEAEYGASGNYGLLDQQAALQWVYDNVAAFGGDPEQITIAGESAGSMSVSLQMASPLSRDLIAGAIGESGASIHPTGTPIPLADAEAQGKAFAEAYGYQSLAELRALSTREVYEIYNESMRFGFPTVIDGYFLPKSIPDLMRAKEHADVPLLLGWNSAEVPAGAFMQGMASTPDNFKLKMKQRFPNDYEEALSVYPHATAEDVEWSATHVASDGFIVYATWRWFDLHREYSDAPTYRYLYSKLRPPLKDHNLMSGLAGGTQERDDDAPALPAAIGAPHACEIEYCLGNLDLVDDYAWTPADYQVSETMQQYFANFIKTGDPNGGELPQWSPASAGESAAPVMILDVESREEQQTDARFHFLDKVWTKK